MSGLTANGFERKRLVDIISDIEDALKLVFGENIDLSAQSGFGQFIGIISEALSDQWESQEDVYNSQYPSTSQETSLSNVVMYNGIERDPATYSTIEDVTISGVVGTTIPAGSQASVSNTGLFFETDLAVVIGGGGTVDVDMTAVETGPIEAVAGTLTVIETPIFGWTGITNSNDAVEGQNEETDPELRIRREASVLAAGQNLVDSLYGQLLDIDDVTDALVIDNKTDLTDANGIPPRNFLSVVQGGTASDLSLIHI